MDKVYTHRELVEIAYKWVLKNASCGVAFKELYTGSTDEIPDVIGFGSWGHSVLVEVKVSRSDFLCDKNKSFRKNPQLGMGTRRYYCCPSGLIKKEDLPEGWGLVYVNPKGKAVCVHRPTKPNPEFEGSMVWYNHEKNMRAEHGLMYSALRRLHIRGLIKEIYTPGNDMMSTRANATEADE